MNDFQQWLWSKIWWYDYVILQKALICVVKVFCKLSLQSMECWLCLNHTWRYWLCMAKSKELQEGSKSRSKSVFVDVFAHTIAELRLPSSTLHRRSWIAETGGFTHPSLHLETRGWWWWWCWWWWWWWWWWCWTKQLIWYSIVSCSASVKTAWHMIWQHRNICQRCSLGQQTAFLSGSCRLCNTPAKTARLKKAMQSLCFRGCIPWCWAWVEQSRDLKVREKMSTNLGGTDRSQIWGASLKPPKWTWCRCKWME